MKNRFLNSSQVQTFLADFYTQMNKHNAGKTSPAHFLLTVGTLFVIVSVQTIWSNYLVRGSFSLNGTVN